MSYPTNDRFAAHFTAGGKETPPPRLGIRFDTAGTFLHEPGNTVICHVAHGSPTASALVRLRNALRALPHGHRFAWTPTASYHMTVFQGVLETRRTAGHWPQGLPLDMPISGTTRMLAARLAGVAPHAGFRMRPASVTPLGVVAEAASDEDERAIRRLRDNLADLFGYRHPDHDTYRFHITLSYQTAWLPDEAQPTYLAALRDLEAEFAAACPVLDLGPAQFCTFDDMTAFTPVVTLG